MLFVIWICGNFLLFLWPVDYSDGFHYSFVLYFPLFFSFSFLFIIIFVLFLVVALDILSRVEQWRDFYVFDIFRLMMAHSFFHKCFDRIILCFYFDSLLLFVCCCFISIWNSLSLFIHLLLCSLSEVRKQLKQKYFFLE